MKYLNICKKKKYPRYTEIFLYILFRYSDGVIPYFRLKARLNVRMVEKPDIKDISVIENSLFFKSFTASDKRSEFI